MDLKRALEIQRVKLLRLVTGWIALLGFLSAGPLALPLPHWVRAFFETTLIRAECAAQYVVQASASMQAVGGVAPTARPMLRAAACEEEGGVPSARALIRRMEALRDVLENLPRYARRLLKVRAAAGEAFDWSTPIHPIKTRDRMTTGGADWVLPRIERPPDKAESRVLGFV